MENIMNNEVVNTAEQVTEKVVNKVPNLPTKEALVAGLGFAAGVATVCVATKIAKNGIKIKRKPKVEIKEKEVTIDPTLSLKEAAVIETETK